MMGTRIGVFLLSGFVFLASAGCSREKAPVQHQFSRHFEFHAPDAHTALYFPPVEGCRTLTGFELSRQVSGETRLYAVQDVWVPVDGKPIIVRKGAAGTRLARAGAILGDAGTRILYAGYRLHDTVTMPISAGIRLAPSERLLLEVRGGGMVRLTAACSRGELSPVLVAARIEQVKFNPEVPLVGRVNIDVPARRTLLRFGAAAADDVRDLSVRIGSREIPLPPNVSALSFTDLDAPAGGISVTCVYGGDADRQAPCGGVLYYR